jgi:hypothetical protein
MIFSVAGRRGGNCHPKNFQITDNWTKIVEQKNFLCNCHHKYFGSGPPLDFSQG